MDNSVRFLPRTFTVDKVRLPEIGSWATERPNKRGDMKKSAKVASPFRDRLEEEASIHLILPRDRI